MSSRGTDVVVRPKRQVTIPREVCEELGIAPGDTLELVVEGSVLKATPRKSKALDAVEEIREAFGRYGVSEQDLLKEARRARREITRERGSERQ